MYQAILFLPLIGALIAGFMPKFFGERPVMVIATFFLFVTMVLSWIVFFWVTGGGVSPKVPLFTWLAVGDLDVAWSLRVDSLTAVMLVVVTTVSAFVHFYSFGYMAHDESKARFFAYLSLFTFAMLALVTSDNLLQLFFGWEGVGVASYLLIGFWFNKPSANAAAIKAFVVNRVGDFGFALGIFALYTVLGTINFDEIFAGLGRLEGQTIGFLGLEVAAVDLICLLLFMGAMGKSAQFLLHTWLPDAMEGPTPVSALIHAATMVTAGVFMVVRLSPLYELSALALGVILFFGAFTALFAASVGLVQNDIKRVIAYSTCSQLGFMFAVIGAGVYSAAVFHLFTHAFFKALLFLGAGAVIHAMHHEQDMRMMGGLRRAIPTTFAMMMIGTLALTGFPLLAGYYSKDAIVEAVYLADSAMATFGFVALVVAALFTSFYSWRLMFMTFFGPPKVPHDHDHHIHEAPFSMLVPLFALTVGALVSGFAFYGAFLGEGSHLFWGDSIATDGLAEKVEAMHNLPAWVIWSPTVMMITGFIAALYAYVLRPDVPAKLAASQTILYQFLLNKWYVDEVYNFIFVRGALRLGRWLWRFGDIGFIDRFGPNGLALVTSRLSARFVRLQSGYLYHYAFAMLLGVVALLTFFMFV